MVEAFDPNEEFFQVVTNFDEKPHSCGSATCAWIKFIPAVLILLPIRTLLILITAFNLWVICKLSECCASNSAGHITPHTKTQRVFLAIASFLVRTLLFWAGILWISVKDEPAKTARGLAATTIVANHVNLFDGAIISTLLSGQLTGVAISWLSKIPIVGAIGKAHHVLFVGGAAKKPPLAVKKVSPEPIGKQGDVESPEPKKEPSPTETIVEYQKQRAVDPDLLPLLIFPEGTTKAERSLVRFRSGAFVGGQSIQPAVVRYPHTHVDLSWVQPLGGHVFRILTQWSNPVEVQWLDLYVPSKEEKEDPQLFANNVQKKIADAMGLPEDRVSTTVGNSEINSWKKSRTKKKDVDDAKKQSGNETE